MNIAIVGLGLIGVDYGQKSNYGEGRSYTSGADSNMGGD